MPILPVSPPADWLVHPHAVAKIERIGPDLILSNGLVERHIRVDRCVATTSFRRTDTGQEFIRSTEPEGRVVVDGHEIWIGGAVSPPNRAFLTDIWSAGLVADPRSIPLVKVENVPVSGPMPYHPRPGQTWPPNGKAVQLTFQTENLRADVRLEIYDDLPVIGKQIRLVNIGSKTIRVDQFESELLATVEGESLVEAKGQWHLPNLTCVTDMTFGGTAIENNNCVHWDLDPEYGTQVSYELKTPCVLNVHPPLGPSIDLKPGESVDSVRSYILLHDAEDRERRARETRTMFRRLAPWTEDNPLMLHIRSDEDAVVKSALDQAAECGFEVAIISFGSGLDMEDTSPANIAKWKALREFADQKGIRLGGYSLLASRRIDDANDVINVKTGKPGGAIFGNSPCLGSEWGIRYFEHLRKFLSETGFRVLEHDGSYPGDPCASTTHPGHRGYEDSQWRQYETIHEFYRWCRAREIFLNVPDTYFLAGSNKTGMGYRETNWSLPREQQHVHARQNLFDGTYEKTPSMGWMFVPLVEYQGGGAAATIEPLKDNLVDYELHFANTLGYGAQACWRGVRLYDAPETKAVVVRMVEWFKKYRTILESDVVHLRRPDGRRLDFVLHANPGASPRAILVVYNPTSAPLTESIAVPLHYAGISHPTHFREREGKRHSLAVNSETATITTQVPAKGWTYFVIE